MKNPYLKKLKAEQDKNDKIRWTKEELKLLDDCIEMGLYAKTILKEKLFPGRSHASIANMMTERRRHG
jgi:hypothetical protein